MINLLQEKNKIEMESQRTNSTFAIRTSRHTSQKLQKSMLLANAPKKTDND